jgi:hypothetical protein
MGHQRRSALITVADKCLLYSERDRIVAWTRNAAKCQNRTSCTAANGIVIPITSWGSRSKGGVHLAWIKVTKFSDAEYILVRVF